jgi:hypothetical protein
MKNTRLQWAVHQPDDKKIGFYVHNISILVKVNIDAYINK